MSALLEVSGLRVGYGRGADVLQGIDLDLGAGEVLGVVGANGAGKSSLLRALAGVESIRGGEIRLEGKSLNGVSDRGRLKQGIVLLPEGHRTLRNLTVEVNLRLAATRFWRTGIKKALAQSLPEVYELFPILSERRNGLAGNLSGGEQQQLSLARALVARPRVLLLDEPSLGLAPAVIDRIYASVRTVIVEQAPSRLVELCDRIQVLRLGETVANVAARDLSSDLLAHSYF